MSYKKIRIQTPTKFVYKLEVSLYTKKNKTPAVLVLNCWSLRMKSCEIIPQLRLSS